MARIKYVSMICVLMMSISSRALQISDFNGTWKEVGYRCVGDKLFKPRPFPGTKFFTITDGNYTHRFEPVNMANCPYVESSGSLVTGYFPGSNWLNIFANPSKSVSCNTNSQNPFVDDFIANPRASDLWLSLENLNGQMFMIVDGDPTYVDAYCSSPIVERIYSK